jgi:hypothetical protein
MPSATFCAEGVCRDAKNEQRDVEPLQSQSTKNEIANAEHAPDTLSYSGTTLAAQHARPGLYHVKWPDFNLFPPRVAHALFLRVHLKNNLLLVFGHILC